jgi:hypothetical protein
VIMLQCGVVEPSGQSAYLVVGNGQGHNTSAGGIAGYVTNGSKITKCTSAGRISLYAIGAGSTPDELYMIYAGGLLGYAGNGSLTTQSSASGEVVAQAPYPYAGGLVGYNYGNLDGSQGSTIKQCFATGNVTANGNNPVPTRPSGLPYAGGLAGYNSGELATIMDSYATGTVLANTGIGFAWAGGVVGANANDGTVIRCYATGAVSAKAGSGDLPYPQPQTDPGAISGGIVGYNYFTITTLVMNCVALNGNVSATGTPPDAYRVVGRNGNGTITPKLTNNYANSSLTLTPTHSPLENTPTGRDGGDVATTPQLPDQSFYENTLGWNFGSVWQMTGSNVYPTLRP